MYVGIERSSEHRTIVGVLSFGNLDFFLNYFPIRESALGRLFYILHKEEL